MNKPDEENLLKRRVHNPQRRIGDPPDDNDLTAVENAINEIEAWLQNPVNERLVIETSTAKQKQLIFQQVKERFHGTVNSDSRPKSIVFTLLTDEQRERRLKKENAVRSDIDVNFRDIIELLIKAKKPIVGHNCFLEAINQFYEEIPEKLVPFKALVHKLFKTVVDTKHLAFTHPRLQDYILKTCLEDVFETVQKPHFTDLGPKIVLDPNFAKYNNSSYHEAGYDAYVTGFTFLRLVAFMLHETVEWKQNAYSFLEDDDEPKGSIPVNEKKEDEPVEKEEDKPVEKKDIDSEEKKFIDLMWTSPKVIGYYNKLHLMRSDFKYPNLNGKNTCAWSRSNSFLLSDIPQNCYQSVAYRSFRSWTIVHVSALTGDPR